MGIELATKVEAGGLQIDDLKSNSKAWTRSPPFVTKLLQLMRIYGRRTELLPARCPVRRLPFPDLPSEKVDQKAHQNR